MKLRKGKSVTFLLIVLIASLAANIFLLAKNILPYPSNTKGTTRQNVVKIIDGDTFDTGEGQRIRLALIDAPEYPDACLSLEAKNRLADLILGKEVTVEEIGRESFGRRVALVYRDSLSVNKSQVEEGLAEGVDDDGNLLLRRPDGKLAIVAAGDVTLRS